MNLFIRRYVRLLSDVPPCLIERGIVLARSRQITDELQIIGKNQLQNNK